MRIESLFSRHWTPSLELPQLFTERQKEQMLSLVTGPDQKVYGRFPSQPTGKSTVRRQAKSETEKC